MIFYGISYVFILTKMGMASFWAIFLPTHLVTLQAPHVASNKNRMSLRPERVVLSVA
jgi:hypothetical protein